MSIPTRPPSFSTARVSMYVPNMQYAADVNIDGLTAVDFGTPALGSATAILNAQSIASGGSTSTFAGAASAGPYTFDANFGRGVSIVLSGAGTPTVTLRGRDYLGQRITETMTGNGTTPVLSVKMYKFMDSITWTAVGGTTMNVGTNTNLGLPYKITHVLAEIQAGVGAAAGTLTAPVLTDPQTATTGDPRGRYVATGALAGTSLVIQAIANNFANASGNGGLLGIRHFAS